MGIWCGAPFGVGYYIWKSLIPTLLGNMVGGGLFVSSAYWYLYLTGEVGVQIDFNIGSLQSAMEAGGPMRNPKSGKHDKNSESEGSTLIGQDPYKREEAEGEQIKQLPHSGGQLVSGIGKEFNDDSPYAKTHAERMKSNEDEEKA